VDDAVIMHLTMLVECAIAVCLSVTLVIHAWTVQHIETCFTSYDAAVFQFLQAKF